jgi:Zn-dependent M28 family amino/carboxypeptidase
MDIIHLLNKVKIENLYKYILNLHYERCPVNSPENLELAGNYIIQKLKEFNLSVEKQIFKIKGSDTEYYNIIGNLNVKTKPKLLITSHYDHLKGSPGADDNLSAVAIMLEVARIMKEENLQLPVQFVSFTLEEQNPVLTHKLILKGQELGLIDQNWLPVNYKIHNISSIFNEVIKDELTSGKKVEEAMMTGYDKIKDQLSDNENEYYLFRKNLASNPDYRNWVDFFGLVGSVEYVKNLIEKKEDLIGVLNLETCGYTSKKEYSQNFPPMDFKLFPSYKIENPAIGDFITIAADNNSLKLAQEFFKATQHPSIELKSLLLGVPFEFDFIKENIRDLLRSDHAPFWKAKIPALMLTDTANFRNPYYHTAGDVIGTLDFEFIEKLTKATLLSSINVLSN